MSHSNATRINNFYILGFPGLLAENEGPVSALLFLIYAFIVAGNILIITIVSLERSLHKPTYLIFCHLAFTDLVYGTVILPKIISKYWFDNGLISYYGCFTQMYFVHFLGATHSFILMVMALDRFVAICAPFHYPRFITNTTITALCAISWFVPIAWMVGVVCHALTLLYCGPNEIQLCYCDHITITRLACESARAVQIVAFILAMISLLLPLAFIFFSYVFIIVAVVKMSSSDGRTKALSTCTPQLFITCLYYMPRCFVYLANNVGFTFSDPVRIIVIMMYSVLPAAVNPVIYCFKTKEIKETLKKRLNKRKATSILTV
uniref:G-protein coupled receptors family 1 profile domain-containing protein n=1 Tax=Gadus morhua TaxID=8049 RepID=A0A8C5FAD0_GADMO